jgi:hypothetical protein
LRIQVQKFQLSLLSLQVAVVAEIFALVVVVLVDIDHL